MVWPAAHSRGAVTFILAFKTSRPSQRWSAIGMRRHVINFTIPPRIASPSIYACLWLDVLDVIGHRVRVHRPVIDGDGLLHIIEEGQRVLHPFLVIAVGEILAGMRAA